MSTPEPGYTRWRLTRAHLRAVAVGLPALLVGTLLRRPDVVVLVAPIAVVALWSVVTRPRAVPELRVALSHESVREGYATRWRASVTRVPGLRELAVALPRKAYIDHAPDGPAAVVGVSSAPGLGVDLPCRFARWGPHVIGPAAIAASSDWGAYRWSPERPPERRVAVVPLPRQFTAHGPLPHPDGLVGPDRSHRTGDGSEMADIRPFRSGDKLRRVHWPVSLRTQQLHVTATHADQDAEVAILVDAVEDLGRSEGIAGRSSTLDNGVRAAGAIAEYYLGRGERVSLSVLGAVGAPYAPARTGRRHLLRLGHLLAGVQPSRGTVTDEKGLLAQLRQRVNPGAVVMVLSPLLSGVVLGHALALSRRGHTVVVIDTLLPGLDDAGRAGLGELLPPDEAGDEATVLAWRLRLLERDREVLRARESGVPVVPWRGPGTVDTVLRDVGRRRRMPRLVLR